MTIVKKKKIWIATVVVLMIAVFFYRYSPYKIQFIGHYDKIWAHRVNSIEKLQSSLSYYNGVELDLEYNSEDDYLDVNHSPAESIHLGFEEYLSKIEDGRYPYLWLDIKQLTAENSNDIFEKLKQNIDSKNYPPQKILIETQQPEALPKFTEFGFMTSYYLPTGLFLKDSITLKSDLSKIDQILKDQPDIGISTDYHDYDIIKFYYPNKTKYIWILVSSFNTEFSKIREILDDETVKVVLVNYLAFSGNR